MSMNVAISINEKFSRYGYVMLSSLFRHHMDEEIKVYVLYRLLSEQRKKEMEELASQYKGKEILFVQITVEDIPFRLPSTEKWPVEVYFRLLLPFLLPQEERILYLDTDIVIRDSLLSLYQLPFENNLLWAAVDNNDGNLNEKQKQLFSDIWQSYPDFHYVNSGVLLMNLAGLREVYQPEKITETASKLESVLFAFDQDLINYLFYDRIGFFVGETYNFFARLYHNSGYTYDDVVQSGVVILHYTGAKPWSGENLLTDLDRFWWEEAKRTPYYEEFLEERIMEELNVGFENLHEVRAEKLKNELIRGEVEELENRLSEYRKMLDDCRELLQKLTKQD